MCVEYVMKRMLVQFRGNWLKRSKFAVIFSGSKKGKFCWSIGDICRRKPPVENRPTVVDEGD